jgi:hypothetical protein
MSYKISQYTKTKAKQLGVIVKPSTNHNKKIDVYKDGEKIASIGSIYHYDFPTYLKIKGKEYAEERQRLYKLRHAKDLSNEGSPGWWSDQLLW